MKEFLMDTIFVYATLIGGIIAVLFAVVKKRRVK
ncbi:EYxxD motif small membrane protein [Fictibacillus solisalsi]